MFPPCICISLFLVPKLFVHPPTSNCIWIQQMFLCSIDNSTKWVRHVSCRDQILWPDTTSFVPHLWRTVAVTECFDENLTFKVYKSWWREISWTKVRSLFPTMPIRPLQVLSSIDTAHLFPGLQIAQSMKILQADQVTCLTWDYKNA